MASTPWNPRRLLWILQVVEEVGTLGQTVLAQIRVLLAPINVAGAETEGETMVGSEVDHSLEVKIDSSSEGVEVLVIQTISEEGLVETEVVWSLLSLVKSWV